VVGWYLKLRSLAARKGGTGDVLCEIPDGRVYTVRVCTRDAAGIGACEETTVGMTKSEQSGPPISQGPMFEVAQDAAPVVSPTVD